MVKQSHQEQVIENALSIKENICYCQRIVYPEEESAISAEMKSEL